MHSVCPLLHSGFTTDRSTNCINALSVFYCIFISVARPTRHGVVGYAKKTK